MKHRFMAAALFVCVLLSACSAGQALPSTQVSPDAVQTQEHSPPPSPSIDTSYIPDIVPNGTTPAVQSLWFYEDEENKYYYKSKKSFGYPNPRDLYLLRKADGIEERIVEGCLDFTLNEGKLYYSKETSTGAYAVYRYDTDTKESSQILTRKKPLYNILICEGMLYFCCREIENAYYENNIYSCSLDGSDIRLLAGSTASWFCILNGKIYYIGDRDEAEGEDEDYNDTEEYDDGYEEYDESREEYGEEYDEEYGEYDEYEYQIIYECSLDGSGRKVIEDLCIDGCFKAAGDKLFYNGFNSLTVYDTKTGQKTDLDYDLYDYAITGQYLVYTLKAFYLFSECAVFWAYDINTGKIYELFTLPADIAQNYYNIYSESSTCYIVTRIGKDKEKLYRLVIRGGKASYEEIV